ncbi:hypothetical protein [Oceanispirochaeta sp.]|jgi:hypothetical protein|uniref:hypothetical protein n=1 Tax=Oceanispirochaeta sp. TaxID=2035350 RepID=UPI002636A2CB|nr:hypothetical protein [Oceanispirochaeta sp.]MDA3958847.1 hypothetical protein [Oceanispirochaeta sp.]
MISKKSALNGLMPDYIRIIAGASNPVFRTCEVLTRIDNLFIGDQERTLGYTEKIILLKDLRKNLEMNLSETHLISRSQNDLNRKILSLIDNKIEQYSIKKADAPNFPKIYKRKSWWR